MVRAISDDSHCWNSGRFPKLLSGRAGHSERAMVAERPELAFIDDLDVMIAALRREMHPFGKIELLRLWLEEKKTNNHKSLVKMKKKTKKNHRYFDLLMFLSFIENKIKIIVIKNMKI